MKRIYLAAIVASALTFPLLSHAQTTTTNTSRADVRAELVAAEQAGQYPQSYSHYPDAAPDAALEYVADRSAARTGAEGSYGSSGMTRSETGVRLPRRHALTRAQPDSNDIYRGQ
ncbi:DUF4148 domain-containing protein [Paraburkholderia sp. BL6669N2]|uniref:DUF4148 domain-containing protein n=1 Tax=Paraburkholderia sp. BL6669N2 TaxID=1938807 RepID=UPI000E22802E|nr:DUF4148 domain-containing protein [Paraburkholderia sp. BL6669N2]